MNKLNEKAKKIQLECQRIEGTYTGTLNTLYETKSMLKNCSGTVDILLSLLEKQQQKLMDKRLKLVSADPKNFTLTKTCIRCKEGLLTSALEQEDHIRKITKALYEVRNFSTFESFMITGPWPPLPPIRAAGSSSSSRTN